MPRNAAVEKSLAVVTLAVASVACQGQSAGAGDRPEAGEAFAVFVHAGVDAGTEIPVPNWGFSLESNDVVQAVAVAGTPTPVEGGPAWTFLVTGSGQRAGWLADSQAGADKRVSPIALDAAGHFLWQRQGVEGTRICAPIGRDGSFELDDIQLALDPLGNTFAAMNFDDCIEFWRSESDQPSMHADGGKDFVFAQWEKDGRFQDEWNFGGPGDDRIHALTVDSNHNVLVAGGFASPFVITYGVTVAPNRGTDGFIARYDTTHREPAGMLQPSWMLDERVTGLVPGTGDTFIATAEFREHLLLNVFGSEQPGHEILGISRQDAVLFSADFTGATSWEVVAGGVGDDVSGHVVAVPGGVLWTLKLAPGAVVGATRVRKGGHVVAKVTDTGTVAWVKSIAEAHGARPLHIAAKSDGAFMLGGESYVGRFDADGSVVWSLSGEASIDVRGIATNGTTFTIVGDSTGRLPFVTQTLAPSDAHVRALVANFN